VADAAARVARLVPAARAAAGRRAALPAKRAPVAALAAAGLRVGARARDVPDLAAAVALRGAAAAVPAAAAAERAAGRARVLRAIARDVALLAALVARLGLGLLRAVTRDVALRAACTLASARARIGRERGHSHSCSRSACPPSGSSPPGGRLHVVTRRAGASNDILAGAYIEKRSKGIVSSRPREVEKWVKRDGGIGRRGGA
jgi:hypothetical protein